MSLDSESTSVLVWGGGTGGAAAAIQAARSGADTLLITPGNWLGGMVSAAGVCCPDGNELTPWQTGLWGALLRELEHRELEGLDHNWVSCFGYRPTTAESILQGWVAALANLRWWRHASIEAVVRRGARVAAVLVDRGPERIRVGLEVLIDGSDRGDLLPLAEAPFRLGWEAQETWGEPSAPPQRRLETDPFFRRQPVQSPTWVVMGQLPQEELASTVPARPDLPAPFTQACRTFGLERTITYGRLPGGLVMLNWPLEGNDWHQDLGRAFSPERGVQEGLMADMQAHSLAFAQVLAEASQGWLALGRAFPSDAGSPAPWLASMPYWREGRRLVGQALVLEQHLLPASSGQSIAPLPLTADGSVASIAVGNYVNDHHYPGPDWPLAAKSCRWGGRWSGTPFCIPYGALVSAEIDNLLVADKAMATSHMANGATRLQPLILNIGQAAGAAAALAIRQQISPAELPVQQVQQALLQDAQAPAAVVPLWDTPWHHPDWLIRQQRVLQDPALLGQDGHWQGQSSPPLEPKRRAPLAPHERIWSGQMRLDPEGAYWLETAAGQRWPLITLEPAVDHWMLIQGASRAVDLVGCANPWGPWLRITGLA